METKYLDVGVSSPASSEISFSLFVHIGNDGYRVGLAEIIIFRSIYGLF